jgi:hypothetical protein
MTEEEFAQFTHVGYEYLKYDVREFGEKHGLRQLTEEKWPADEVNG